MMPSEITRMLPLHPIVILPVAAGATLATAATRTLSQVRIDSDTTVNLTLVLGGMGALVTFVVWFTTVIERARASRAAQNRLLELIVRESRDINEYSPEVQALLFAMRDAEGKPSAKKKDRRP